MAGANSIQYGGDHYKSEYEHWDFVHDTGIGYLQGCATKYIARHRKKGGRLDLEKAWHYVQKAQEMGQRTKLGSAAPIARFAAANSLTALETSCIAQIVACNWKRAAEDIAALLADCKPADSGEDEGARA